MFRDNDSETSSQTGDINYIDFATRILYHLRLCFDPEFVSISDASVAHKWLIIATVEVNYIYSVRLTFLFFLIKSKILFRHYFIPPT